MLFNFLGPLQLNFFRSSKSKNSIFNKLYKLKGIRWRKKSIIESKYTDFVVFFCIRKMFSYYRLQNNPLRIRIKCIHRMDPRHIFSCFSREKGACFCLSVLVLHASLLAVVSYAKREMMIKDKVQPLFSYNAIKQ